MFNKIKWHVLIALFSASASLAFLILWFLYQWHWDLVMGCCPYPVLFTTIGIAIGRIKYERGTNG